MFEIDVFTPQEAFRLSVVKEEEMLPPRELPPVEPMTLAEFREHYDGVIIGNCGYSKEDAEQRIEAGNADIAAIGRPFISNPDLVERWQNGWELEPYEDMSLWYTEGAEGYTDYTPYSD